MLGRVHGRQRRSFRRPLRRPLRQLGHPKVEAHWGFTVLGLGFRIWSLGLGWVRENSQHVAGFRVHAFGL